MSTETATTPGWLQALREREAERLRRVNGRRSAQVKDRDSKGWAGRDPRSR